MMLRTQWANGNDKLLLWRLSSFVRCRIWGSRISQNVSCPLIHKRQKYFLQFRQRMHSGANLIVFAESQHTSGLLLVTTAAQHWLSKVSLVISIRKVINKMQRATRPPLPLYRPPGLAEQPDLLQNKHEVAYYKRWAADREKRMNVERDRTVRDNPAALSRGSSKLTRLYPFTNVAPWWAVFLHNNLYTRLIPKPKLLKIIEYISLERLWRSQYYRMYISNSRISQLRLKYNVWTAKLILLSLGITPTGKL